MHAVHHALLQVKGWRGWLHYRPEPSAGRHIYELNDSQGEPLDLDVIDNTWLDANVQVCSDCRAVAKRDGLEVDVATSMHSCVDRHNGDQQLACHATAVITFFAGRAWHTAKQAMSGVTPEGTFAGQSDSKSHRDRLA